MRGEATAVNVVYSARGLWSVIAVWTLGHLFGNDERGHGAGVMRARLLGAAEGRDEIRVIHGIGTGALRRAVRDHLPRSHYVVECAEASREDGGAGATRAVLRKD